MDGVVFWAGCQQRGAKSGAGLCRDRNAVERIVSTRFFRLKSHLDLAMCRVYWEAVSEGYRRHQSMHALLCLGSDKDGRKAIMCDTGCRFGQFDVEVAGAVTEMMRGRVLTRF